MDTNYFLVNEKLIIGLLSAAVALLFGQLALYLKYRCNQNKIKKALLEELRDIDISLDSAIAICRHN
ncbi:hypothetical protein [Vibrio sp. L3-7]|uniref:hypothetical protein n=1 Tax=Vibrio sp. L3-7 TaxID=2912253 RepID=UPI00119386A9|nr:hypothetical protein [Vibrio sp. L3-7]MCF7506456.1 hypothetical protein [Vibrio sp. L3-7]TVU69417.1 hypothetical protein FQP87_21065 [Vibrio tasmaniensis]